MFGDRLIPEGETPRVCSPKVDARNAAAMTLAEYLKRVLFTVAAGDDGTTRDFQLEEVREEWPESFDELKYPSAAITTKTHGYDPHGLTPSPLDDSRDVHAPNSVLWKTDELVVSFQVDFWCQDKPTREAIAARLPDVFAPSEGQTGIRLEGPAEYFSLPIRFTLTALQGEDSPGSVWNRQRELRATIVADLDVVHLREAHALNPSVSVNDEPVPTNC
jgi:hypothetical protein